MVTAALAGPLAICASMATETPATRSCALGAGARQPMPSSVTAIVSASVRV